MPITLAKLTPLRAQRLSDPGLYSDGGGLYLQITSTGTRSWLFRYRMGGRKVPRDMGLGPLHSVTLAEAREKATGARKLILNGIDPIDARRQKAAADELKRNQAITFKECAEAYISSHKHAWRNGKHAEQWTATLAAYVYPKIGDLEVQKVGVTEILRVLEQKCDDLHDSPVLWKAKNETASRLRGRIEVILSWAKVRKYRSGENPAQWRGNLEHSLAKRNKARAHHPALPFIELAAFMENLKKESGTATRALEFVILTATRTSETLGAQWSEIDQAKAIWTIPANRIKAGREHRVPLSPAALAILEHQGRISQSDFVFPGSKKGKPLSTNSLLALLKRMKRVDITVHGFRSTFRDWAAERTSYSRDVAEMALAHAIGDKVEAAYRRGDLLEKRKRMMDEWTKFCLTPSVSGAVISLTRAAIPVHQQARA